MSILEWIIAVNGCVCAVLSMVFIIAAGVVLALPVGDMKQRAVPTEAEGEE